MTISVLRPGNLTLPSTHIYRITQTFQCHITATVQERSLCIDRSKEMHLHQWFYLIYKPNLIQFSTFLMVFTSQPNFDVVLYHHMSYTPGGGWESLMAKQGHFPFLVPSSETLRETPKSATGKVKNVAFMEASEILREVSKPAWGANAFLTWYRDFKTSLKPEPWKSRSSCQGLRRAVTISEQASAFMIWILDSNLE